MNETNVATTELLTKMQVIKRYFPGCGYNTVNPVFYENDFPKLIIPGKKRLLDQGNRITHLKGLYNFIQRKES